MGSSKKQTVGYWYRVLYHTGLTKGPIDAFLEFRGGDKTAWQGEQTESGTISVNAPNLWGGENDQGGIVGDVDLMFGEPTQAPNAYLLANLGPQVPAWRGLATLVFKGGRYGAMNPYPQPATYKIRRITAGWEGGCWYPETAEIPTPGSTLEAVLHQDLAMDATVYVGPPTTPGAYIELGGFNPADELVIEVVSGAYTAWSRWPSDAENGGRAWSSGVTVTLDDGSSQYYLDDPPTYSAAYYFPTAAEAHAFGLSQPPGVFTGSTYYRLHFSDELVNLNRGGLSLRVSRRYSGIGMNPAHALYYARTDPDAGREPVANINAASLTAAADTLFAEGFGICTERDPSRESVEEFEARITKLIDGSFGRDPVTGQWHLDLARGDYVLEDLPILTDDDIIEFVEVPAPLDNAINSVSVSYFDPARKERITTRPVQARGLVQDFGTIHQTIEYPEIPDGQLAALVAQRELQATATPTRAFRLVCTRKPYSWRQGTYFRLQVPKRGIADMVCIVGTKETGTLKSGAIRLRAAQDIYSMPATTYVQLEPGVDTSPPQDPTPITLQAAYEVPYIDVVTALSRADLAVLPADVGYLATVAADPSTSIDYTVQVDAGAGYAEVAIGDWAPTATVVEQSSFTDTDFTLAGGVQLASVAVGSAALWGAEIVRVDALDAVTGAISLGRACADTVPVEHAAGERIWFFANNEAADETEYTDGETVAAKLLTNTGSQQLALSAATPIPLTFAGRAARPYPPGALTLNGEAYPIYIQGPLTVGWAHRDRVVQADQLIDATMGSIGPEPGTTYPVDLYGETDTLLRAEAGLAGDSYTWATEGSDSGLTVPGAPGGDPHWPTRVALLHFNGADGSTNFVDEVGHTFTAAGNAQIDTSQSLFGGAAGYFDGAGDYVWAPDSADWDFGAGDFTIELAVRFASLPSDGVMTLASTYEDSVSGWSVQYRTDGGGGSRLTFGVGDTPNNFVWAPAVDTWYQIEISRSGTDLRAFVDGAQIGSTITNSSNLASAAQLWIGALGSGAVPVQFHHGWIDEVRITKGRAEHTANYTPASVPFLGVWPYRRNNLVRVVLGAERDGLPSLQTHNITVRRVGYGYSYGHSYGGIQ